MSTNKYESLNIPILKKSEYPTWKVKIMMYLKASDSDYLDIIFDGPCVLKKLVPQVDGVPKHYVKKTKTEMTPEEKTKFLKDAKVRTILYNSLDSIMSNRVIARKTAKEI